MGARQDLADAITAALPGSGLEGAVVYAEPADVVSVPCIVIDAGDPYIAPMTHGPSGPGGLLWNLALHLVAARTDVASSFGTIETMRATIVTACNTLGASVGDLASPQTVTVNEVPTLQADLVVAWLTERTV